MPPKEMSTLLRLSTLLVTGALTGSIAASVESTIQWGECGERYLAAQAIIGTPPFPIECSNFTVPLDYTDPESNGTVSLPLVRVPALKQPSKGSIVVHFGGPSPYQSLTSLIPLAEQLFLITGQSYDLVSWDQRGTGDTLPFDCFETQEERDLWTATKGNGAVTPEDKMAWGRNWALNEQNAQICHDYAVDKHADVSGTVDTVRDIVQIVDALGGDQRIRFYGLSYGCVVGSTLAAMFPEKMERLVLDAVANPHQFYAGDFWEMQTDSDKVLSGYFRTCFEKPELCALAERNPNSTAEQMEAKVYELFDELKYHPIPLLNNTIPTRSLMDNTFAKEFIRMSLYNPASYPSLAMLIQSVLDGDLETFAEVYNKANPIADFGDGSLAITCSDSTFRPETLDDAMPLLQKNLEMSRFLGDWMMGTVPLCMQWKLPLKERFERGFHDAVELKTPPFIIGNEYDVVTPYVSAVNISATFPGSSPVKFNTFGHGILNQPSKCTADLVRKYLEDGEIPSQDTVCEPFTHPWENTDWSVLYEELEYVPPVATTSAASPSSTASASESAAPSGGA